MAAIDIGSPAIDRASGSPRGSTFILMENPANLSGKITKIAIYCYNAAMQYIKVATFIDNSDGTFTTRDNEIVGYGAPIGYSEHVVDLDVEAGDYIGYYTPSVGGYLRDVDSGFAGKKQRGADNIPCTNQGDWADLAGTISLYGTGETIGGPTGGISPGAAAIAVGGH